ncbi:hypothetical protein ACVWW6_000610 [Bradyrhizobium sp. USDA 3311]
MLKDGTYSAWFKTPRGEGTGIVHFENGKISGGDSIITYGGTYETVGDRFTATVTTKRHTAGHATVFGIDDLELKLDGVVKGATAKCTGTAAAAPGLTFEATLIPWRQLRLTFRRSTRSSTGHSPTSSGTAVGEGRKASSTSITACSPTTRALRWRGMEETTLKSSISGCNTSKEAPVSSRCQGKPLATTLGEKDPLAFSGGQKSAKKTGEIHQSYQWDLRSSRFQNEIESFLKRKSSRFQSVRIQQRSEWWARQDSNLQPDRYERPALTIELQAPLRATAERWSATVRGSSTGWPAIRQCQIGPIEPRLREPFRAADRRGTNLSGAPGYKDSVRRRRSRQLG